MVDNVGYDFFIHAQCGVHNVVCYCAQLSITACDDESQAVNQLRRQNIVWCSDIRDIFILKRDHKSARQLESRLTS